MTKLNGNDIRLYIGGYDIGGSQMEGELVAEEPEGPVTGFNDTAERVKSLGLRKDRLSHGGYFDDDAADVNELLKAGVGSQHIFIVQFGIADEKPSAHGKGQLATSYGRGLRVGDFVKMSAAYSADDDIKIQATAMMVKTTIISFPHTGGTVDDAASSSAGCSGVLQIFSITGGTDVTVVVDHSTDNFVGSDDPLLTFTAATGRTSEMKEATGTIRRYRRITITETGGVTSLVMALSFQRD